MKNSHATAVALAVAAMLGACSPDKPPAEALRPVRTAELRYDDAREANRYVGTVQSRHEVDQAFRVGGKVVQRKVDVGQFVREGDVLAVLDDADYRLAEEAARQQRAAAVTAGAPGRLGPPAPGRPEEPTARSARPTTSARTSGAQTAQAAAEAEARKLELARNRLKYTVLRASRSGVVTAVRFEVGQVVAEGPAGRLDRRPRRARDRGRRARGPAGGVQDRALQGIAGERAGRDLRRGAARAVAAGRGADAHLPRAAEAGERARAAARRDRHAGGRPRDVGHAGGGHPGRGASRRATASRRCGWCKHAGKEPVGTVELVRVSVHGYRNDEVLVSGPPAGAQVVTAGVQKMAPGLKVALPGSCRCALQPTRTQVAAR